MSKLNDEFIKTVTVDEGDYYIYGFWDEKTPDNEYKFYDVFDQNDECINEGEPFFDEPTEKDIKEFVN